MFINNVLSRKFWHHQQEEIIIIIIIINNHVGFHQKERILITSLKKKYALTRLFLKNKIISY